MEKAAFAVFSFRGCDILKALSLYEGKDTIIHKVDPISKLLYILAIILIPIILPTMTVALICLAVSTIIILLAKIIRKVIPLVSFSFLILLSIFIIQGLFKAENETPLFQIGRLTFYMEGLYYALEISIRVLNILSAFAILVLTTKPSDLIETLVRKGVSPRLGYVLSSVLQLIPQMTATMGTITDAQRSRGMETEGKLRVRLKAFIPLIGPVVMSSLLNTGERSMALEVRGFNSKTKKTFINEENISVYNRFIHWGIVALIVLAIIWRIIS